MVRLKKFLLSFIILLSFASVSHAAFKTDLTDTQMQNVLQNYFPVREYSAIARVSLQQPKVILSKDSKDIVLVIPVDANITGDTLRRGHVRVLLTLSYKHSSGGLYLSHPRIQQFEMPGVSKDILVELKLIVDAIGKTSLPLVRIYSLKERDINHSLAKTVLKKFYIEDGRLKLEFGFN